MVSTPAPPPAPDPNKAAAAQAGMNRDTAIAQQQTNMTNQVSPQGSLSYNRLQGQDHTYIDSNGKEVTIPRYEAVTKLSPEEQQLYDLTSRIKQNIGQIGVDQSQRIGDLLSTPVNLNNEATEARLTELGTKRLDPRFAREEETLRTRLANQGVGQGSAAWNDAFNNFNQARNDAYNQLYLSGRQQAVQEALAQRNQPINEISALLSGSQVSMPQQIQTPQSPVQPVDYIGMLNSQYQAQMQAYGQQLAARSNMLGGIFGVLGKGIGLFPIPR
jgi:hypothetical protein